VTYLLDASVFIQAKNLHNGLDFCPAFWDWLIDNGAGGRVFSIDKVAAVLISNPRKAAVGVGSRTRIRRLGRRRLRKAPAFLKIMLVNSTLWC
jgi:hypothetical protein